MFFTSKNQAFHIKDINYIKIWNETMQIYVIHFNNGEKLKIIKEELEEIKKELKK